jgi:5-methyltetrahydrofolate--homocysteine methyltransferase
LILTQPDAIEDIHADYLRAGADIVATNTFSSTSIAQADYGISPAAYELNREGANWRAAAARVSAEDGKPAFRRRRARPDQPHRLDLARRVNNPGLPRRHLRRSAQGLWRADRGLLDGGADLLLVETIFDTLNAKAAIYAIAEIVRGAACDVPVMISGTITDLSGRTAVGPDCRSVLAFGAPRQAVHHRAQLRARRQGDCAPISPTSAASPTRWSAPIPMPACPTNSASMTKARNIMAG